MAKPKRPQDELNARAAGEVALIVDAFSRKSIEIGVAHVNHGVDFLYQKRFLIVRDEYLDRVTAIVGQPEKAARAGGQPETAASAGGHDRITRIIEGVVLLSLKGTRFGGDDEARERGVLAALAEIDSKLGAGAATPNQVLTVAAAPPPVYLCPATEPEEVPEGIEPYPGACAGNGGAGVRIYIADTGLLDGAQEQHPWLVGVEGDPDPLPQAPEDIPAYTGHGTFVAGVARCMAPGAYVYVGNVFAIAGSELESEAVPKLSAALELGFDIFHLTIAAPTRQSLPLQAFNAWRRQLSQYKGVVCIVAAGNSGTWRPFWPAAFPEMVSVGALAADWRSRARFSNYGGWVDVYAPGRDLVNAYASGTYAPQEAASAQEGVRHFFGMARWSGTSFSTPIVSGLVAARMSSTGENGMQAAAALLAAARSQAIPGVGAILLPCMEGNGPGCDRCAPRCRCHPPCRTER